MKKLFKNKTNIIEEQGKVLAEYDDIEFYLCAGGEIEEGVYQIKDGVVEICGEDEDYEIVFIKNIKSIA